MGWFEKKYFLNGKRVSCYKGCAYLYNHKISKFSDTKLSNNISFSVIKFIISLFIVSAVSFSSKAQSNLPANIDPITLGQLGASDTREYVGKNTEMVFSVLADATAEAGTPADNDFHWIVYGGTILEVTGGTISGSITNGVDGANSTSEVISKGWTDGESAIKIRWQNSACGNAFIAVKQTSAYNCSDGNYSIYYIKVVDGEVDYQLSLESASTVCEGEEIPLEMKLTNGAHWLFDITQEWTDGSLQTKIYNIDINSASPGVADQGGYYLFDMLTNIAFPVPGDHTFTVSNFRVIMQNGGNECVGTITGIPKTGVVNPTPNTSPIEHN